MDISAIGSSASVSGAQSASGNQPEVSIELPSSDQWSADRQDAFSFSQALEVKSGQTDQAVSQTEKTGESSFADGVLNKMQSLSSEAAQKGEALEKMIVKATDSLNPTDVIAANRMMSEYYLENLMTAKLIGNATKAIERLTSLQ